MTKKLLIIAGSDPSGGAGLQVDIKVAAAYKVYASAVVASLTAQNTKQVVSVYNPPVQFLKMQLEAVLDDIQFDVIKIGMLARADIIDCVADILAKKVKKNPIVLDPVMVATSGDLLLEKNAVEALKNFAAQAFLITPNVDEAKVLAEMEIKNIEDMKCAALKIKDFGVKNVLIKGGHSSPPSLRALAKQSIVVKDRLLRFARNDGAGGFYDNKQITNILLDEKGKFHEISNKKLDIGNVHGTGCSLASAIACNLAYKKSLLNSVKNANNYIYEQLLQSVKIGKGSKILKHF